MENEHDIRLPKSYSNYNKLWYENASAPFLLNCQPIVYSCTFFQLLIFKLLCNFVCISSFAFSINLTIKQNSLDRNIAGRYVSSFKNLLHRSGRPEPPSGNIFTPATLKDAILRLIIPHRLNAAVQQCCCLISLSIYRSKESTIYLGFPVCLWAGNAPIYSV